MRILGVDPGLQVTGYGIITHDFELVEAGIVRTKAEDGIGERLRQIYDALNGVIDDHNPDTLVIEKIYTHVNHPATAILMGHARGAVCLLSGARRLPLVSIASTHVKKAISGRGHAGKLQIQRMVQHRLGLKTLPEPADVADALAVAIAYAMQSKKGYSERGEESRSFASLRMTSRTG